ncbi:hypothetical protein ACFL35_22050, partial [Candidatus Riflebacteria bacterium]
TRILHLLVARPISLTTIIDLLKEFRSQMNDWRHRQHILFFIYASESPPRCLHVIEVKKENWTIKKTVAREFSAK